MLSPKIEITDKLLHYIQSTRLAKGITAADLSSQIGRTISYVSSLENHRISKIMSQDLIRIFKAINLCSEDEAIAEIENMINSESNMSNRNINDGALNLSDIERQKISELRKYSSFIDNEEVKEFESQKNFIIKILDAMYEQMPEDTVRVLRAFCSNLKFNVPFTIGIASMPFSVFEDSADDVCPEIYKKMSDIFMEFANKDKLRVCKLTFEDGNISEKHKDGRPDLYIRRDEL